MNVAGTRASQLSVSTGIVVCGQNMTARIPRATAIETMARTRGARAPGAAGAMVVILPGSIPSPPRDSAAGPAILGPMSPVVVRIATAPGPRGQLCVAATAKGVVAIDILAPPDEFMAALERRLGPIEPGAGPNAPTA